ncbi:GGDEF domain-containing protein [Deinococcus koreensis]|nr:GGDEF domain-containing protein [Deinococcus koreensis]
MTARPPLSLDTVLGGLYDGVFVLSRTRQLLAYTPRAAELLGVPSDQLTAERCLALGTHARRDDDTPLPPDERPVLRCLASGQPQRRLTFSLEGRAPTRWLRVTAEPLWQPGEDEPFAAVVALTDVSEGVEQKRALRRALHHDGLTGLPNRAGFEAVLEGALAQRRAGGPRVAVALVDLDDFKGVNDRLGHAAGDALLQAVARRLRNTLPASDVLARLYGDEFALLRWAVGDRDAAELGQAVLAALAAPVEIEGAVLTVSCSVGVIEVWQAETTAGAALRRADALMNAAKRAGKGSARVE